MKAEIYFPDDFPILNTSRLSLKQVNENDAEGFFNLRSDSDFMKYLSRHPMQEMSEAELWVKNIMQSFEQKKGISWKICHQGQNELLGYIGFWQIDFYNCRGEVGFGLHPNFQGKGLMKEALLAILDYGFNQMNIHSVLADIDPNNLASAGLLQSCGFQKEGYIRENFYFDGNFLDSEFYGILKRDLEKLQSK